jgi:malic enzyme
MFRLVNIIKPLENYATVAYSMTFSLRDRHLNKIKEDAINLHRALRGKIEIHNRVSIDAGFAEEKGTLGLIYTPGVVCC